MSKPGPRSAIEKREFKVLQPEAILRRSEEVFIVF